MVMRQNATVRDILFEDVRLEEVYLGITIDCDYETHGTVVPNIGVLATNVTYRNVTGTVVAGRPRGRSATLSRGGRGAADPTRGSCRSSWQ